MFRPCIDIHDGVVKQIVGGTLTEGTATDEGGLVTNFVSPKPAEEFARMYRCDGLYGGHVIMLGASGANRDAALAALAAFPGGITATNATEFLEAGASHVIVTSFVFRNGTVDFVRLEELVRTVGRHRLVLDLSCRKRARRDPAPTGCEAAFEYVVVTDRWQKWTDVVVDAASLSRLGAYASEFLVHGVDVEGLRSGIEDGLVQLLGAHSPIPVTYAGGVRGMGDLQRVVALGGGRVAVSVGSALDVFGGSLSYQEVVAWARGQGQQGAPAADTK